MFMKEEEEDVSVDAAKKFYMSEKNAYEVLIPIEKEKKASIDFILNEKL